MMTRRQPTWITIAVIGLMLCPADARTMRMWCSPDDVPSSHEYHAVFWIVDQKESVPDMHFALVLGLGGCASVSQGASCRVRQEFVASFAIVDENG